MSCIKAEVTVRESTRNDVAPPAETMTVVDAVNVSQVVLFRDNHLCWAGSFHATRAGRVRA